MSKSDSLFRKTALEKMASPESLDQLIKITSPMGWLILSVIIFLIVVVIIWGFLGTIPTSVQAAGILTRTGGIYTIQTPSEGIILSINVKPGDVVKAEEVVARLSQMDYLNRVKMKKQDLQNLKVKYNYNEKMSKQEMLDKLKYYDDMVNNTKINIEDIQNRIIWLEEQLKNKKELYQKKLITKDNYLTTEKDLNSAKLSKKEKTNEINRILNEKSEFVNKTELDILSKKHDMNATELALQGLQVDFVLNSQVFSSYEGKILDVNAKEGTYVSRGQSLMTLEKRGKDISNLKAVLYINPFEAKKVKFGMMVNVSPTHVKQEEYGCMLGLVTYISPYPATKSSMMKELDNESLITNLSPKGSPYKIKVTLIPDPRTVSGFKWTTQHGYPYEIVSGTLCNAQIEILKQRPIEFVLPIF